MLMSHLQFLIALAENISVAIYRILVAFKKVIVLFLIRQMQVVICTCLFPHMSVALPGLKCSLESVFTCSTVIKNVMVGLERKSSKEKNWLSYLTC